MTRIISKSDDLVEGGVSGHDHDHGHGHGHIHQYGNLWKLARRLITEISGYIRLKNGGLSPGPAASDRICQSSDHQPVGDRGALIGQMTLACAEGSSVTVRLHHCKASRVRDHYRYGQ